MVEKKQEDIDSQKWFNKKANKEIKEVKFGDPKNTETITIIDITTKIDSLRNFTESL